MKTQIQGQTLQVKNEINFFFCKKKKQRNKELHYIHIQNANTWKSNEQSIIKKNARRIENNT
jgi:hypothetical protein